MLLALLVLLIEIGVFGVVRRSHFVVVGVAVFVAVFVLGCCFS